MTKPALRLAVLGLLLAFSVVLAGGQPGVAPPAAVAQATEQFAITSPPKVYSGIPSHAPLIIEGDPDNSGTTQNPADANPTLGTNGYCVFVRGEGHTSLGAANGFSVVNGTVIDSDYFDNGSATTTDDVYCVVVRAARLTAELPRPDMIVRWTYLDGGSPVTIELAIKVVTVQLVSQGDGFTGIPATVCTRGWDPLFLTGFTANNPPETFDVPDVVVAADWETNPGSPAVTVLQPQPQTNGEWCVNLNATTALTDIDVTFRFWALYNLNLDSDDVLITETATDLVDFVAINAPELRHITQRSGDFGGQVDNRRAANPNVIGAAHTACVLPSVPADVLRPQDIQFLSPNGATVSGLTIFTSTAETIPGVPEGTKCFTWTSLAPGYQEVFATIDLHPDNPLSAEGPTFVSWDTNLDGNGGLGPGSGLLKYWNVIDRTVINRGGNPFDEDTELTNSTITVGMAFNVRDGTFVASVSLTEWVIGSRPGPAGSDGEPIDGVPVRLEIVSACGYFGDGPPDPMVKVLDRVTLAGRIGFKVNILNDPACGQGSIIQLRVQAAYPPAIANPPPVEVETLTIRLVFVAAQSSPIVAWVGTRVTLNYGFAGDCPEEAVLWTRESGDGSFIPDGPEDSPDVARSTLVDCESIVEYTSERPGEVVITATLVGNPFSKVEFPVFFIAFEDLTLSAPGRTSVSEPARLSVSVRGWFMGSNLSGNLARVTEDGRALPRDRWVLPDDWARLRGPDGFRPGWPSSPPMPPVPVTFFMENEGATNSFRAGIKGGAAGFFLIDATTFAPNVSPVTGQPSKLGSIPEQESPVDSIRLSRPRIISTTTGASGGARVEVFGDFNLSFEECGVNAPTGSPHCEPGDVVGRTTYFAVADYPQAQAMPRGKHAPVTSKRAEVAFEWRGYKRVTVEPGPTRNSRYVVVHLKDRDGFCDATNFNNTLGIKVEFAITAGAGIITSAADLASVASGNRKSAVATTFDTLDDNGKAMNEAIVRTVAESDECQAWIRIDNSLPEPAGVQVTFPAAPSPIPGKVEITTLACGPGSGVILTNTGTNPVSLAGFALRSGRGSSRQAPIISEEHLGLEGHLQPGGSMIVPGDPLQVPWRGASGNSVFSGGSDYARLVWEERTVAFRGCDGSVFVPDPVRLHRDDEGPIVLNVVVNFHDQDVIRLARGWNLVPVMGWTRPVDEVLGDQASAVDAIYTYDADEGEWQRMIPALGEGASTIRQLEDGRVYWVLANRPFTLVVPR